MTADPRPYLDNLFNVLNEAVFVYDENMEIKHFNTAAEITTGHKKKDVIGKKCVTLFDKSVCLNNCALCMTVKDGPEKQLVRFESPFLRKDGARRLGEFQAGLLQRKPDGRVEVLVAVRDITELTDLKQKLKKTHSFRNIIGKSSLMKDLFQAIQNIAAFDTTVLIQGESGTGKELVARAIHYESPRSRGRLITVNCSVFSEHLLESELFGHVQGAFTGAVRHRVGQIEEGHGGTIFLDEIGDLTPQVQIKLLRVLQEKEIQRVGENATRKVNIRIIAASNKNLLKEVREGRFREDLYYRLNVIPIHLPPLRMRKEDIPGLARHFIQTWRENQHKWVAGLSDAALSRLLDHDWPGNVRELENAIEYACVKCTGTLIRPGDLPEFTPPAPARFPVRKPRRKVTPDMVRQALAEADHNQTRAAKLLNLHRTTLWRKMKTLGIDR